MTDDIPPPELDPTEVREWIESVDAVIDIQGRLHARRLLDTVVRHAHHRHAGPRTPLNTDYINSIPPDDEPDYPGDEDLEKRIRRFIRWNAVAMVVRGNNRFPGLGGHLSTYASAASLYEVGFNHFFRGRGESGSGDQVYYQGHAAPGIYARAFLEGRLTEDHLEHFRREVQRGRGLSSYPHPRLMPEFWEFPTVSMGLGPIAAIYQARFNRYLQARGIKDTSQSRVWCFVGDGETDEPETLGALSLASRENLDNLVFVVNCNLQRLDGPVRGNGKIIQELEAVFRGAGWRVIKVIWGKHWDPLLESDQRDLLVQRMNEVVDGEFQKYTAMPGSYAREHFFGEYPELLKLVEDLSDYDIANLRRGGHDLSKINAAYDLACNDPDGRPVCILAHTVKGWTLAAQAKNATHQVKKMTLDELRAFRDKLHLDIPDDKLEDAPYAHPGEDSDEVQYMKERRAALGGEIPVRHASVRVPVELEDDSVFDEFFGGSEQEVSTTMAFVRMLTKLLDDDGIGDRIVPIIPDEARTFGAEPLFRKVGIYSSKGQLYEPVDKEMVLYYRESKDGQLLEEGITEAGSMASFTAAGTSYATHDEVMIPFYMFYSMFGFQRTGDQIWAFGDMRGRGFLMGGTAGRTTLNGEGLQHQDGNSLLLCTTLSNIRAYEPAFAYEIALVVEEGLRRMVADDEDIFYYITLHNENYAQAPMPEPSDMVREGVLRGLYGFRGADERKRRHVQLLGSGSILQQVLQAQEILAEQFDVSADVWSATSYQLLRRDALQCERWNRLHPMSERRVPWVREVLDGVRGPFIAASDWVTAVPDQIHRWVPGTYVTLGTDGYGMSDTREALRRHFEVDAESIAAAALWALHRDGKMDAVEVAEAIRALDLDPDKRDPLDT